MISRGASPLGLPYTRSRAPLRRRAPIARLASLCSLAPGRSSGSLGNLTNRSAGIASRDIFPRGLRPRTPARRARRARSVGALRSRGRFAALARAWDDSRAHSVISRITRQGLPAANILIRGASPLSDSPYTRSRAPLRRRAPIAWLASLRSLAPGNDPRAHSVISRITRQGLPAANILIRGASPLGLPYTRSRAPLRRRAPIAWLASLRSLAPGNDPRAHSVISRIARQGLPAANILIRGASPLGLPYTRSRAPLRRRAPIAWLASLRSLAPGNDPRAHSVISRITRQGLPAANIPSGTSRVTTLPAPMTARDPMRTPGRMMAPPPTQTSEPISIGLPNSC